MTKEVAIIGGSAAGFHTALLLAEKGSRVSLFEAEDQINHSSRTLIVTKYLQDLLGPVPKDTITNRIRHFELFTDGRFAKISLQHPDLVIDRSKLIRDLAAKAQAAGVEVLTGRSFLGLKPNGRKLAFNVSHNGDVEGHSAETLVAADGAFSKVARSAGWAMPVTVPLVQTIVDLPNDQSPDTTRVWFIPEETPYFFWLIPHSPTQGVLGLIGRDGMDEANATERLERFVEKKNLVPLELQSACIPVYRKWTPTRRKIGKSYVYLTGDAAGHVKVSTVGGIVTGFRGAMGVAESILDGGRSTKLRHLKRELDWHSLIRKLLNEFGQEDYSRLVDLLTASAKHTLGHITRDESRKLIWTLIIKQPRFLLLGLRSLLRTSLFSRR